MDENTTPISIENVDYIKWQLESDSCKLQIYPVETTDADNDGIIYNDTFQFNISDGTFSDSISMVGESGSQSFSFYAADLNGHVNEIDYNISDGNGSPDIELDTTNPVAFTDNKRYFSIGDEISFSCHVGPTGKTVNELSYRVSPGDGTSAQTISFSSYSGDDENGYTFYFEKSGIGTTNYDDTAQILILDCTALGASESSSENIFFTADNVAPEVYRHSVASGTDEKNTYVDFEITDSSDTDSDPDLLWGSRYRASELTASDLEIVKTSDNSETIAISFIKEISDFDSPSISDISGGTGTFRIYLVDKSQILSPDGLTSYTLRSASSSVSSSTVALDKANNVLSDYEFVFLDEEAPSVDSLTPDNGAVTSFSGSYMTLQFDEGNLTYSGTNNITITKDGTPSTVTGSITTTVLTNDTLSIPFPGGDGVYTVSVPSGVVTDISDNPFAGISSAQWAFTVDTADPVVGTITAKAGGFDPDITGTLIPAPSSNIVFTIPLTDTSALSRGSGDKIQLIRSVSSNVDINMNDVTLNGSTATVSLNYGYFDTDEDYHLRLLEGAFIDAASNPSPLTNGNTFTVDADPPSIDTIEAHIGGAVDDITGNVIQAPSSDIEFTIFMSDSTTISKGTGDLIQLVRNSTPLANINMDSVNLSGSTATLTVASSNFTTDADYNLRVLAGAFNDSASNTSVLTDGNTFEVDETDPSVGTITAKIVGAGDNITGTIIQAPSSDIEFTIPLSDNSSLSKGSGDKLLLVRSSSADVPISMGDVNLSGSTATVTVSSSNFTSDEDYHLRLLEGAFLDEASNPSPLTNGSTFKVDDTPPAVTSIEAKIGGAGDDITDSTIYSFPANNIVFTINLSDSNTISRGSGTLIELRRETSTNIDIDMSSVTLSGSAATVTVSKDYFTNDETYRLRVEAGAFIDAAANSVEQYTESPFTVDTKPYVVDSTRSPADGSFTNDTSPTISFNFDEDVLSGTGDNAEKVSVDGTYYSAPDTSGSISFTLPSNTLSDGNTYSVAIDTGAYKDVDGTNHFCEAYSGWSFTVDTTDPVVGTIIIQNGGTGGTLVGSSISNSTISSIVFTMPVADTNAVDKGTGSKLHLKREGSTVRNIDMSDGTRVSYNTGTKTATVTLSKTDFSTAGNYSLSYDEGAFVDAAENPCGSGTSGSFAVTLP